ncbi:MAG: hypothetical protein C5B53_13655 [Candidatus Melainabacteria bacterium]|nr:MAG: hypothetical protein C5B53_13655 [Candidatus Melainabacteria bacterium]
MTQSQPDGSPEDVLTKLLATLRPDQQEALRRKLNEKAWNEQFNKLCAKLKNPGGLQEEETIGKRFASSFQHLIDRLSSGDIDEDIKQACRTAWETFTLTIQSQPDDQDRENADSDDPQIHLEIAYQAAQNNLIGLRQAVAQAIATEKQLEKQVQQNKDQAATWQNRADMATQQNNEDLCKQALQRKQQYKEAALALEQQHEKQKEAVVELRDRFTKLELEVQKFYTKKQLLVTRAKVAAATVQANEILNRTIASGALSVIERMEQKVAEREAIASHLAELSDKGSAEAETEVESVLIKAATSIDRLALVLERLERRVNEDENKEGIGSKQ